MITFPLWFIIYLVCAFFFIIWQSYIVFSKNKYVVLINQLPDEQRNMKINKKHSIMKVLKMLFWAAPFYLIFLPYLFYLYQPNELFHYIVMAIIVYVLAIADFFCTRSILSNLNSINKLKHND